MISFHINVYELATMLTIHKIKNTQIVFHEKTLHGGCLSMFSKSQRIELDSTDVRQYFTAPIDHDT